jgi:hypothetical protein
MCFYFILSLLICFLEDTWKSLLMAEMMARLASRQPLDIQEIDHDGMESRDTSAATVK